MVACRLFITVPEHTGTMSVETGIHITELPALLAVTDITVGLWKIPESLINRGKRLVPNWETSALSFRTTADSWLNATQALELQCPINLTY